MPEFNQRQIEQIREIIDDQLSDLIKSDKYTFSKKIKMLDGRNFIFGRSNGTKFGTATDQLISFWNATPVNQPATVADVTGQVNDLDTEARAVIATLIDRLQELGLIA